MLSNYLAELWGISLVVISLALLIKDKNIKIIFSKFEKEENLFCCGFVTFAIGLSMVLAHNIWIKNWQVVITIFGWISLAKGLSLLFFPEFVKNLIKKMEGQQWLPFALVISVFIGLALAYFGFTA